MKCYATGIYGIAVIFSIMAVPIAAENESPKQKKGFWAYLMASKKMPIVQNDKLNQFCKECHWVHLPGLLPQKSWEKLMENLHDHFGDNVKIDETSRMEILEYLRGNSSDKTDSKVSMKITKSAGNTAPIEISKIKYIKKIHHDIKEEVWKRPGIKSRGDCIACHRKVDKTGDFDEHDVKVPKE